MTKCEPGEKVFVVGVSRLGDTAYLRDKGSNIVHTGDALSLAMLLHVKKGRGSKAEEELKDVLGVLPTEAPRKKARGRRKPRRKEAE